METNKVRLGCVVGITSMCILLAFVFRSSPDPAPHRDEDVETHLYVTWDRFEVDRCVATWLIKRFLDPEAEFEFHPVGSPIRSSAWIAYDTPGARYERTPGKSVSAVVLAETGLEDPAVDRLVQLVQTTEVAFWMMKPGSEEANLRDSLQAIWMNTSEPKKRLQPIFDHIDKLVATE